MKGCLSYSNWYIFRESGSSKCFHAERVVNGEREYHYFSAHCLACAKVEILMKYGGKVDLRGWQKQGGCGSFLKVTQGSVDNEG
jgi:hypothetical protein